MKTASYRRGKFTRAAALGLLALAAALLQAREACAQWAPTDAAGNTSTTGAGNVGIGTPTPTYPITIVKDQAGATAVATFNRTDGAGAQASFGASRTLDWSDKYISFGVTAPSYGAAGLNDTAYFHSKGVPLKFGSESPNDILFFTNGINNTRMAITGAGNVGIGTTTPLGVLNVPYGEVIIGQNYYQGATLRVGRNDANLPGIVTATNYNDGSKPVYRARSFDPASLAGDGVYTFLAQNALQQRTFSADHRGNGYFAGDLTVAGNIAAKYQDVAEWVPTTQKLSAGTVVVLDTRRSNHVAASAGAYDTRVAGVISARPGIALGEAGEGKVLVATTGRVKVRVDATRAAIQIGDLIVTSDVEGVAMKSEPIQFGGRQIHAPGTIIGKALEPLEKGTGEILVLLSLQ